jgi:flagellar protein FlaG
MDINSIGNHVLPASGVAPTPRVQTPPAVSGVTREQRQTLAADVPARDDKADAAAGATKSAAPGIRAVSGREEADDPQNEETFRQNLQESVEELNEFVLPYNTSLRFSIEEELGTVVVKVTDKETREVIKQIPSEEAVELAKALDKLKGLLIQQQA